MNRVRPLGKDEALDCGSLPCLEVIQGVARAEVLLIADRASARGQRMLVTAAQGKIPGEAEHGRAGILRTAYARSARCKAGRESMAKGTGPASDTGAVQGGDVFKALIPDCEANQKSRLSDRVSTEV